jgi:hypothetical protein
MGGLRQMSTELLFLLLLGALVFANVALEFIARWRNPPIGEFLDIDGVRLHFIIVGDPDAPPLVMFHGNGTLLQDLTISGLVDAARRANSASSVSIVRVSATAAGRAPSSGARSARPSCSARR